MKSKRLLLGMFGVLISSISIAWIFTEEPVIVGVFGLIWGMLFIGAGIFSK
jgi:hypothetical protein